MTFTYQVRATTTSLTGSSIYLRDDNGTPGDPSDDFTPTFVGGDTNGNQNLDLGETWTYTATRTISSGPYVSAATVLAIFPVERDPVAAAADFEHLVGVPGPTAVPTLDGIGLGALAMALMAMGALRLARRGQAAAAGPMTPT